MTGPQLPTFLVGDNMRSHVEDDRIVLEGLGLLLSLSPHAAMALAQGIARAWADWHEGAVRRPVACVVPFAGVWR